MQKHIDNIEKVYHLPTVVTLNKYESDTNKEIELVKNLLKPTKVVINEVWAKGGDGARELAQEVLKKCNETNENFEYAYDLNDSVENKIRCVVKKIYGGKDIFLTDKAKDKIKLVKKLGYDKFPVIIAKTQFSLSDDAKLLGAPTDFDVTVRDIEIKSGAKFLVVICGKILLMPGLSKTPAAVKMKIDNDGIVDGLF